MGLTFNIYCISLSLTLFTYFSRSIFWNILKSLHLTASYRYPRTHCCILPLHFYSIKYSVCILINHRTLTNERSIMVVSIWGRFIHLFLIFLSLITSFMTVVRRNIELKPKKICWDLFKPPEPNSEILKKGIVLRSEAYCKIRTLVVRRVRVRMCLYA